MNNLLQKNVPKNNLLRASITGTLLFFVFFGVHAQTTVRGTVKNEIGTGLPSANVLIKGTSTGTVTDLDGKFQLENVSENTILIVSYLGYVTQEVAVGNNSIVDVQLEPDLSHLAEVIVVAYGEQKTKLVTGSVAAIEAEELKELPLATIQQKLQGRLAGVQINQTTGRPGGGTSVRIRGAASISAGNQPLYVVDGLPINGGLNNLNPNEVEDISVLKGAAAASLYGSRAANGVVLVTTKQAKKGQEASVNATLTSGVGQIPEYLTPDLLNAKEWVTHMSWYWEDRVRYQNVDPANIPEIFRNPEAYDGPDTDWYDELLRSSLYQDYSVSFIDGSGSVLTSNVATFHNERGNVLNSDFQRFSLRSNNTFQANDNLKVGFNMAPTFTQNNGVQGTDGRYQLIWTAVITPPIFDPNQRDPDGTLVDNFLDNPAPVWSIPNAKNRLLETTQKSSSLRLLSNVFAELDFLKDFKFRTALSVDYLSWKSRFYNPSNVGLAPWHFNLPIIASGGSSSGTQRNWVFENSINYTKTINDAHNIDALVLYSSQEQRNESLSVSGNTFANDEIPWISAATNRDAGTGVTEWTLASFLARVNYDYQGKYLLRASYRRDGSSRFGADNRWGSFPSISAGWVVSEENFMKNQSIISFLKLRAEHGKSGNFNLPGNYRHLGNTSASNYVINGAVVEGRRQTSLGNSLLTWETSIGSGIGFDIGLFNDRFEFTFDYYQKTTDGLFFGIDVPLSSGFGSVQSNIGEFDFWGYEFSGKLDNIVKDDFTWTTRFNISFDRNKTVKLGTNDTPLGGGGAFIGSVANKTEVGQPLGQFWGLVSDGVYVDQADLDNSPSGPNSIVGGVKWRDINGDGVFTNDDSDRTYIGNPQPDFIYGITNEFTYKNFDLSVHIAGAYGHDMQYGFLEWTWLLDGLFNVDRAVLGRWRSSENPGAGMIPGSAQNRNWRLNSDLITFDASYLAIKNITLGYNLPQIHPAIKSARINASIQNAHIFTNYPGVNPEATNLNGIPNGVDNGAYPVPRTYALGLSLTF
ncbi:TonB-dependent receptor [Fulvivirgaceae bacterium BMA10]|uniref:TonB-dependent receptor n=1 Tax=Splendidivirga corallicola TaxID=3051826 RepID=A0ABT8KNY5_9BACT|nr:TonB-dependent receptor [Fulvivirgaceae bacterium BMA10]